MVSKPQTSDARSLREVIRFYLIDCETVPGKLIDIAIIFLNLVVVSLFILSTYDIDSAALRLMEKIIVIIFIVEYGARLYGSENRIAYIFSPYAVIDCISILPTLLEPFIPHEQLGVLVLLRAFRVFRIFRFIRFFETTDFFFGRISTGMLRVLRLVCTIFMIFFIASGLFYIFESGSETGMISNFGDAFYFSVVTLTTVGFGDIVPVSGAGKAVTVVCILAGIFAIPWQVGKIIREWLYISQKSPVVCTTCGLKYHDRDAVHCKACGALIYQEFEDRSRS
ncbi:potassium channel family protein [bacterium]|nr:potassium channel family protein [bacterium]